MTSVPERKANASKRSEHRPKFGSLKEWKENGVIRLFRDRKPTEESSPQSKSRREKTEKGTRNHHEATEHDLRVTGFGRQALVEHLVAKDQGMSAAKVNVFKGEAGKKTSWNELRSALSS